MNVTPAGQMGATASPPPGVGVDGLWDLSAPAAALLVAAW